MTNTKNTAKRFEVYCTASGIALSFHATAADARAEIKRRGQSRELFAVRPIPEGIFKFPG